MVKRGPISKEAAPLSDGMILVGVFFAFQQAWELLSAARILHDAGKFSSAYGLAVFCREEIGKSRLLEQSWRASVAGRPVFAKDLNTGDFRSHTKKLGAAGKNLSEGMYSGGMLPDPGSSEAHELLRHIREVNVRARERDPEKTHLERLRAFYVEMHETGAGWWKPWTQFYSFRASRQILEAELAYPRRRCELSAIRNEVSRTDPDLARSLNLPPELEITDPGSAKES